MPTALVINPNTSATMTAEIEQTAKSVFAPAWRYIVARAPAGPESLESWTDYHIASVSILPLLEQYPHVDGVVLACFGDPGLYVLKETCRAPAVGIAEASMSLALLLGARFGILAGMGRAVELMDSMVRTYGLESRYAGCQSLDLRVLDFEKDRGVTLTALKRASLQLRARGAEALLLGCAGLTGFVDDLQVETEMPVIDPVEAGCRLLQTIYAGGLNTSHVGLYSKPAPQHMQFLEKVYSEEMQKTLKKPRR